ncbi:YdcF family protein [Sphingobacterium sp. E70]|uniref:YdcF family protein n=1 Tax=Sphingobacterium sp. E70 TaxID=2853439 RepID=UPI00211CAC7D|nr:YdcF family protein [Sphingobacterium sp. E70]ULT23184.1 YdcF family protein [Sphingobacterium sp. E70]
MKDYLVLNHIPSQKIIVDNYGNDTEKTVVNSIRIMDSLHYKSAISISQYFHQTRTKALFRKKGICQYRKCKSYLF